MTLPAGVTETDVERGVDAFYEEECTSDRNRMRAALTAALAGRVVVPREPTREMWAAGGDAAVGKTMVHHDAVVEPVWRAMLAAAVDGGA